MLHKIHFTRPILLKNYIRKPSLSSSSSSSSVSIAQTLANNRLNKQKQQEKQQLSSSTTTTKTQSNNVNLKDLFSNVQERSESRNILDDLINKTIVKQQSNLSISKTFNEKESRNLLEQMINGNISKENKSILDNKLKAKEEKLEVKREETLNDFDSILNQFNPETNNYMDIFDKLLTFNRSNPKLYHDLVANKQLESIYDLAFKSVQNLTHEHLLKYIEFTLTFFARTKYARLKEYLDGNLDKFTVQQTIRILMKIRKFNEKSLQNGYLLYYLKIKEQFDEIIDYESIVSSLQLFYLEKGVIDELDNKLLSIINEMKNEQLIDLLRIKSILRQRSSQILTALAYNLLINKKTPFNLNEIQQCLLSCGLLNFNDNQLLKRILNDLNQLLLSTTNNTLVALNNENETSLLESIIISIGILKLRDESLLDTINDYLLKQIKQNHALSSSSSSYNQLIANFIISLAHLNYKPKGNFNDLLACLQYDYFKNDKLKLITLTWSLCVLNKCNIKLNEIVLDDNFNKELFNQKQPFKKDVFQALLKLLHINLYTMVCNLNAENENVEYKGPLLSPHINTSSLVQEQLIKRPTNAFTTLISTLSSFTSKDKLFKSNLLMPFGLFVDVFLIVDRNGQIKPLDTFYNRETDDYIVDNKTHFKIVLKLIDYKQITLLTKHLDGPTKIQLKLLNALDYLTIPIYSQDLLDPTKTILNRVQFIQSKLKEYVKNPKLSFIE